MAQEALPPPTPLPGSGPRAGAQEPTPGSRPFEGPTSDDTFDGSIALDQLLDIAVLTPPQATHLSIELLLFASTMGQGRRTDVPVTPPMITSGGQVHVRAAREPSSGVVIDDVLTRLVDNARRLPVHPRLHQVELLQRLDDVTSTTHEPAARALMLREALDDAIGAEAATRMPRELAALVAAFAQVAEPRGPSVHPIPLRQVQRKQALKPLPPSEARRNDRGGRIPRGPMAAAAVLVCLVAVTGVYF